MPEMGRPVVSLGGRTKKGGAPANRTPCAEDCLLRSEQVGDGVEGDSCGGGFEGCEHCRWGEGGGAVFEIEFIHGGEQAGAALGVVEGIEQVQRVEPVGNQAVELNSYEVGLIVLGACGTAGPQATQGGDESLVVLTLTEAQLAVPAAGGDAETADG